VRENTSLEDGATVALEPFEAAPEPVFVDDTGKRRRRIRLAFYAVGAVSLTYAGLVAVSLLGGPLKPESLLPFPETFNRPAANAPSPMTGEAARLAKKAHPGTTRLPGPSGKPGTPNPANAIAIPPTQPGANGGTTGATATPTPEATPTPTPTPTPSPNPPTPPVSPAPSGTGTNPATGGQGGGGGVATGQGGQPQDTNTGTVVPIETTPVAAPNPAPTNTAPTNAPPIETTPANPVTETANAAATGSEPATTKPGSPAPSDTASPAAQL
jgi:hypothetical protein